VISQDSIGGRVIDVLAPANVSIIGVTLTNGKQGALQALAGTTLYMQDVDVAGNAGNGFVGGVNNQGTATLVNVSITDNQTSAASGGVFNNGTIHIRSSLIARNTANVLAGGMRNIGIAVIENTTISGNTVTGDEQRGGGLSSDGGTYDLRNVTITGNSAATQGGGIFVGNGGWRMTNTIISGNSSGEGTDCYAPEQVHLTSGGGNLIGSAAACEIFGDTASDMLGVDPLLEPLADNGGATHTHALGLGSDAVNTAVEAACPAQDQRGAVRFDCDIGAYEAEPFASGIRWGDTNCDGLVDARDALHLILSEGGVLAPTVPEACPRLGQPLGGEIQGDINCDGGVNEEDAVLPLRFRAGVELPDIPDCPPVGQILLS
jgi:hypothetical protein